MYYPSKFLWIFLLSVAGCQPSPSLLKGARYLSQEPISLPVNRIECLLDPKVHHYHEECPDAISLTDMVKQWSQERFSLEASTGILHVYVEEASLKEVSIGGGNGIRPWLSSLAAREKYVATLKITFKAGTASKKKSFIVILTDQRPIPENYTLSQRKQLAISIYEDLIDALNREVEKNLLSQIKDLVP